jgi:hypothetical protein
MTFVPASRSLKIICRNIPRNERSPFAAGLALCTKRSSAHVSISLSDEAEQRLEEACCASWAPVTVVGRIAEKTARSFATAERSLVLISDSLENEEEKADICRIAKSTTWSFLSISFGLLGLGK